ncbi:MULTISPECIES: terminase small subunit [unclassified Acidocella]|uniref:terminase small subunit n=1 Tax=unclassified Acidocella TaxID=2648610 RepID=UPI00028C3F3D|nr:MULTISPECIES: terminase small subunit [unclassified Acidocella]EKN01111.1 phage DNA packaging Nu1 [Acidocella sp. MX-AZ02]WBO60558.1 terminase small subunit [Acidocella sp. MX-AZ03]
MAYTGAGQRVNRVVLADFLGVSLPTIDTMVRNGCPVIQRGARGREWIFSTADVVRWQTDRAAEQAAGKAKATKDELERRKLEAETQLAELQLAKAKELVAPIEQMETTMSRAFAAVRAGFLNLPGRVTPLLIGETDERKFKAVLLTEVRQTLEALANTDLAAGEEGEEEEEQPAPAG